MSPLAIIILLAVAAIATTLLLYSRPALILDLKEERLDQKWHARLRSLHKNLQIVWWFGLSIFWLTLPVFGFLFYLISAQTQPGKALDTDFLVVTAVGLVIYLAMPVGLLTALAYLLGQREVDKVKRALALKNTVEAEKHFDHVNVWTRHAPQGVIIIATVLLVLAIMYTGN